MELFELIKFKIFIPPTRNLWESLVLNITFNKHGVNFCDRNFSQFHEFYTYFIKLIVARLPDFVIQESLFSKNFL